MFAEFYRQYVSPQLVTRLSGLEPFEIDGDALGKDCQKK